MSVGARSAAAAPFCLLQVLEVNQGEGRELTRCKVDPEEATFDEARLSRSGQQAGSALVIDLCIKLLLAVVIIIPFEFNNFN